MTNLCIRNMPKEDKSDFHSFLGYSLTCVSGCVQTTENHRRKRDCIQITWTNYTELQLSLRVGEEKGI